MGGGGHREPAPHCVAMELFGVRCLVLGLDELIEVKRAAGRPKDLEAIAEPVAIRESGRQGAARARLSLPANSASPERTDTAM